MRVDFSNLSMLLKIINTFILLHTPYLQKKKKKATKVGKGFTMEDIAPALPKDCNCKPIALFKGVSSLAPSTIGFIKLFLTHYQLHITGFCCFIKK